MTDLKKTEQITRLLIAEKQRALTSEERQILEEWLKERAANKDLYNSINNEAWIAEKLKELSAFNSNKAFLKFTKSTEKQSLKLLEKALRIAAVLIPFLFGIYFLFLNDKPQEVDPVVSESLIQPGSSKAILQLADGTLIDLEKEETRIATENGAVIDNNKKEIVYHSGVPGPRKVEYNSIEIPRGGEYQLVLSDGTKVWLNSETSIRFPVVFSGKTRELQLSGEAYFEVAENKDIPFILHTSGIDIHVTGTAFNVRAYSNEKNMAATLVEGEVNVIQNQTKEAHRLKPGQQAVVSGPETQIGEVNVEQFVAWKNGRIYFENNSLEEILSNLERWYDVEVSFTDERLKALRFSIDVERYTEFNRVFEIIELTRKVKFNINENQIIVLRGN
jgi:ferric-dicitrate binding protein FerR (iron transport regulator)